MKLRDIITGARVELLEPLAARPSRRYLLQKATFVTQSFFNRLTQSGRAWAVCEQPVILTVTSGQSEYLLPVGDEFGRVLDVHTIDPSNPSFIERPIDFWELGDLHTNWFAPKNAQSYVDSAGHTAQRISFFKKGFNNNQYVSIVPTPQTSSSYSILFALGAWAAQMSLDDSPLLTQHHGLLVCKTALDSIPAAAWFADERENRLRRNELIASLTSQLPIYMKQFDQFASNSTMPRITMREMYAIE